MRLFVVVANPSDSSLRYCPHKRTTPYPPGPGLPIDEPSVYIVMSAIDWKEFVREDNALTLFAQKQSVSKKKEPPSADDP